MGARRHPRRVAKRDARAFHHHRLREGTRALFAGSYAVFRNPAGHREVNYDDVAEAAEAAAAEATEPAEKAAEAAAADASAAAAAAADASSTTVEKKATA